MALRIQILHLEDDPADGELIAATLQRGGLECDVRWVTDRPGLEKALAEREYHLILADYQLPGFDGWSALQVCRRAAPEVPFLFVSGFIGEESALEALKAGAIDYVFKHNLVRLAPAVTRALQEARAQREHRRAQAALEESESTLRSFFDTAPFMMGIVELLPDDLLHLSANAASAGFWGSAPEAMRRRRASELGFPPFLAAKWCRRFREAQRRHQPVQFDYVHSLAHPVRHLSVTVSELPATPGQAQRFCYVAEDVSAKRELERQFLRAQRLESIGTLAGGIAHDLNNVLSPILTALKSFRTKLHEPADQELLLMLESSARRGSDIIRQVLTFSRGVAGERRPITLSRLIGELEQFIHDTFPRAIHIESHLAPDLWNVMGDSTQIYQVLINLCLNARDAMPDGGVLSLHAENVELNDEETRLHPEAAPGPHVLVKVADTGVGIAPDLLSRVFDPFFTTKAVGQGTGLGLSTTLSIAKAHGGFISVASTLGHGAEFSVCLPAAAPSASLPEPPPALPETPRGAGEWILIVDDEAAIRRAMATALEQEGYRILTAPNGAEGLALFGRHKDQIRLVLTDMVMPGMGGCALIENLQQIHPPVRIIVSSGMLDANNADPSSDTVVFLQKPFSGEELIHTVHQALHRASTPPPP